jgi:hypothetical protein
MTKSSNEKSAQDVSDDLLNETSGGASFAHSASGFSLAITRHDVAKLTLRSNLMDKLKQVSICSSCHGCG